MSNYKNLLRFSPEIADAKLSRSFGEAYKNVDGNGLMAFDMLLASTPSLATKFNKELKRMGLSTQVDYSDFNAVVADEEKTRSYTESNTACVVTTCSDVIMEIAYCEQGMHDYFQAISTDGCETSISLEDMVIGSSPEVPTGSNLPTYVLDNQKCIKFTPAKYGEYSILDLRKIRCNTCIDFMLKTMKALARRMFNARETLAIAQFTAKSTLVPAGTSLVATIHNMQDVINASRLTARGAYTLFVPRIVYDRVLTSEDSKGNRLIKPLDIACEGSCRTMCFDGIKIVEIDSIAKTVSGTQTATTIYMGYTNYAYFAKSEDRKSHV